MQITGECTDLFNIKGFENMKRGAVWMVDLGYNTLGSEQDGQKTCVIVQNDIGNSKSPTLIVAVITSKCKNNIPTHVEVDMFAKSTVLCEQIKTIDKNRLSILGGEPLCDTNFNDAMSLCDYIKRKYPDITIYAWTGYTWEYLIENRKHDLLSCIDVLIDGKFELDKKDLNLKLKGSSNQRVINVKESLEKNEVILYE